MIKNYNKYCRKIIKLNTIIEGYATTKDLTTIKTFQQPIRHLNLNALVHHVLIKLVPVHLI